MFAPAASISLQESQIQQLRMLARAGTTTQRVARRCRVILLAHEGTSNSAIAQQLGLSRPTVNATRAAFLRGGVEALQRDPKRKRSRRVLSKELEQQILDTTLKTKPPDGTHWSVRGMAQRLGVARMLVQRVWQRFDVQPHRVERFKLSNDPHFDEKVRDVVGLYLDPPDQALVLCVDEKSQIQALDRTRPILPLRPGLPERQTHDYKRHGTTTLFAAFNILTGKVIGSCLSRHRGKEFVKFLNQIGEGCAGGSRRPHHSRQLQHPQRCPGPDLVKAQETTPVSLSLHSDQQFLAQSSRTLVRPDHRPDDSARYFL